MEGDSLIFADHSGCFNLILPNSEYKNILKHCVEAKPRETGGILIGHYSKDGTTAIINEATPPPEDSLHKPSNFLRGTKKLVDKLNVEWERGYYYLGEWHYHPNSSANPSLTDRKQMIYLSKDKELNCPEPILLIIGESKDGWIIHIEVCSNKQNIILVSK